MLVGVFRRDQCNGFLNTPFLVIQNCTHKNVAFSIPADVVHQSHIIWGTPPPTAQMIWNLSKYQEMHFIGNTRFPLSLRHVLYIQTFAEEQTKSTSSAVAYILATAFSKDLFWSNVTEQWVPPAPARRSRRRAALAGQTALLGVCRGCRQKTGGLQVFFCLCVEGEREEWEL